MGSVRGGKPGAAPSRDVSRYSARTKLRRSRLGNILVLYRASLNIGVRELAKDTGLSAATLSRIERGHAMDAATLIKLWSWLLASRYQGDTP